MTSPALRLDQRTGSARRASDRCDRQPSRHLLCSASFGKLVRMRPTRRGIPGPVALSWRGGVLITPRGAFAAHVLERTLVINPTTYRLDSPMSKFATRVALASAFIAVAVPVATATAAVASPWHTPSSASSTSTHQRVPIGSELAFVRWQSVVSQRQPVTQITANIINSTRCAECLSNMR